MNLTITNLKIMAASWYANQVAKQLPLHDLTHV